MQAHIVFKPLANVSLTVTQTASGLPEPPVEAVRGLMRIEGANVRMRFDGEDPAGGGGPGYLMKDGEQYLVSGRDYFASMKFVRDASTDAVVVVAYDSGG